MVDTVAVDVRTVIGLFEFHNPRHTDSSTHVTHPHTHSKIDRQTYRQIKTNIQTCSEYSIVGMTNQKSGADLCEKGGGGTCGVGEKQPSKGIVGNGD